MDPSSAIPLILALMIGAGVLIALVAIIGGFLQTRRERLLTHQERLKALELGREIPDDAATARMKAAWGVSSNGEKTASRDEAESERSTASLSRKAFSTAIWVAFWGFLAASQSAAMANSPANIAVVIAIAASVGAIGVTAAICGTILAMRVPYTSSSSATAKAAIESDAFDVVSRRGG